MRVNVTLKPVKHPRYSWRVTFPETLPDGDMVRRQSFFTDKRSAQGFASLKQVELGNHGVKHAEITDAERQAVIHFRLWAATRPDAPALLDLVREGIVRAEENRPRLTVSQVIAERRERLKARQRSARHDQDTRLRLDKFEAAFGPRQISEVTGRMVEDWLHGLKLAPVSLANYRRALNAVFIHALKRKAIAANPIKEVDLPEAHAPIPGKLTPDELNRLLRSASPQIRPSLALQAFTGIRRAEMERLLWEDVRLAEGHIRLGAHIAKTRSRRVIPIPAALAAWLALDERKEGKICPTPQVYSDRLLSARKSAQINTWPPNCLRHSAATYLLANEENAERVALWLGNSPAMLKKHYDALATKAEAQAWFSVLPSPPETESRFPDTPLWDSMETKDSGLETDLEMKAKNRKRTGNGPDPDGNGMETPANT